jgi:hypothetical protein|tara:strand:- start:1436 stop:2041 length:606 start_codon:yes stop_codon:yes gene_type:complete
MGTLSRARARAGVRRDNSAVEAASRLDVRLRPPTEPAREDEASAFEQTKGFSLELEQRRAATAVFGDEEVGTSGTRTRVPPREVGEDKIEGETRCACVTTRDGCAWTPCVVNAARAKGRAILVARGVVYDATDFVSMHPSGEAPILRGMMRDNTEDYEMHSARARKHVWEKYRVGVLARCERVGFGAFEPPAMGSSSCVVM